MKTILIMSGKGGVGKTTVSVNLAKYLLEKGYKIGLLDADMTGPNTLKMLGQDNISFSMNNDEIIPHKINEQFKVASVAGFIEEGKAVIWRGSLKHKALEQLSKSKEWDEVDYLIVDFPPGTSDEHISAAKILRNVEGAIIVSTPQNVAIQDTLRSIDFCHHLNIPIIGLIENMSSELFGQGKIKQLAEINKIDFLGQIPLRKIIVNACEQGKALPEFKDEEMDEVFETIVTNLLEKINQTKTETNQSETNKQNQNFITSNNQTSNNQTKKKTKNILIPVMEANRNATISKHFGHAPFFAIYDEEKQDFTFFKNTLVHNDPSQSAVAQAIKQFNPKKVLVFNVGEKAQKEFEKNDVEIEFVEEKSIEELVRK